MAITLQLRQIFRICLCEQEIQITPTAAGSSFDQLHIFNTKNYRSKNSDILAQLAHRAPVEIQAALLCRPINFGIVPRVADDPGANEITFLTMTDEVRARRASK